MIVNVEIETFGEIDVNVDNVEVVVGGDTYVTATGDVINNYIPDGGTTGQHLAKVSNANKDVGWVNPEVGSGSSSFLGLTDVAAGSFGAGDVAQWDGTQLVGVPFPTGARTSWFAYFTPFGPCNLVTLPAIVYGLVSGAVPTLTFFLYYQTDPTENGLYTFTAGALPDGSDSAVTRNTAQPTSGDLLYIIQGFGGGFGTGDIVPLEGHILHEVVDFTGGVLSFQQLLPNPVRNVRALTTGTTSGLLDSFQVYPFDATAGDFNFPLIDPTGTVAGNVVGRSYSLINRGATGTVTLTGYTVDGVTGFTLSPGQIVTILSTGTEWITTSDNHAGSGGAVSSVNGDIGAVTVTPASIGAATPGDVTAVIAGLTIPNVAQVIVATGLLPTAVDGNMYLCDCAAHGDINIGLPASGYIWVHRSDSDPTHTCTLLGGIDGGLNRAVAEGETVLVGRDNTAGECKVVFSYIPGGGGGGLVNSVTATAPLASTGGTDPDISIDTSGFEVSGAAATAQSNAESYTDTVASGKADLVGGTVPAAQLPSYVDDVLEFANLAAFPGTGESGKIYVAQDTNLTYRWGGSAYGVLDPSLALGETSSTAYRGDRGKTAYDHSQLTASNPHGVTTSDVGLGNVDNTSDANKPVSTAQQTALNLKAPLASPTFTGTVTVPTPSNTTDAATKGYVDLSRLARSPKPTTGGTRYAVAGLKIGTGAGNYTLAIDTIYWVQLEVGAGFTYDRIGTYVVTGAASKSARVGLYADDGTGRPGALIVDHGTASVASSATGVEITVSQAVTPGLYWAAIHVEAGIVVGGWTNGYLRGWMNSLSSSTFYGYLYTQARPYASGLPATATPVEANSNTAPDIRLRVA